MSSTPAERHADRNPRWRERRIALLFFGSPFLAVAVTAAVEALLMRLRPPTGMPGVGVIVMFVNAALAAAGSAAAGFLTLRTTRDRQRVTRALSGGLFGFVVYACLMTLFLVLTVN